MESIIEDRFCSVIIALRLQRYSLMVQNIAFDQNDSTKKLKMEKENLTYLLTNQNFRHPVLNRIQEKLVSSECGVETCITSYDRMHHRHSRS